MLRSYVAGLSLSVAALLISCTPSSPVTAPQDVVITSTDGGDPCAVQLEICRARLIRNPDGTALCLPCDAGK